MRLPADRRARILAACGGDKRQAQRIEREVVRAESARANALKVLEFEERKAKK
jgi:hypothetical protein